MSEQQIQMICFGLIAINMIIMIVINIHEMYRSNKFYKKLNEQWDSIHREVESKDEQC